MELEIRHLRALCAIAQTGSISAASARLGISQPALSTQLQRLERLVGGNLFERGRSGAVPTDLGERLVARARMLLSDIDAFGDERADGASPAELTLGSVHMDCLATLFQRLQAAVAPTELSLNVDPSSTALLDLLARKRADAVLIAISDGHELAVEPDLVRSVVVPRVPIFVAVSENHRLAGEPTLELADLADDAWIEPPGPEDGSLAAFLTACSRAGFSPRIRFSVPSGAGGPLLARGEAVRLVEPTTVEGQGVLVKRLTGDPLHARLELVVRRQRVGPALRERMHRELAKGYVEQALLRPAFRRWWTNYPELQPLS